MGKGSCVPAPVGLTSSLRGSLCGSVLRKGRVLRPPGGLFFFSSCFFLPVFNQQGNVGSSLCKQTITKSSGTALRLVARTSQQGYVCFRNATDSAERVQGIIPEGCGRDSLKQALILTPSRGAFAGLLWNWCPGAYF